MISRCRFASVSAWFLPSLKSHQPSNMPKFKSIQGIKDIISSMIRMPSSLNICRILDVDVAKFWAACTQFVANTIYYVVNDSATGSFSISHTRNLRKEQSLNRFRAAATREGEISVMVYSTGTFRAISIAIMPAVVPPVPAPISRIFRAEIEFRSSFKINRFKKILSCFNHAILRDNLLYILVIFS